MQKVIWVIDDEQAICWALKKGIEQRGYVCKSFPNAEVAIRSLSEATALDAVLLDMRMPGMDGFEATAAIHRLQPKVPIVMMTAFGDLSSAIQAIDSGIVEYLTKPFDLGVALRTIERAMQSSVQAPAEKGSPELHFGSLLGRSPAMQNVYKQIALAAKGDMSVHVDGPSGIGKEAVASAIHRHSLRASNPFLVYVPSAISPIALSLELLGSSSHVTKNSFQARSGAFELAGQGVLFIEEVADLPLTLQTQLLRVLEKGCYTPMGDSQTRTCVARVITSTERDLKELVAEGEFLEELRQRLCVFVIELKSLQERREDIVPIARDWLQRQSQDDQASFSSEVEEWLESQAWPGNIRELRSAIARTLVLSRGGQIQVSDLQQVVPSHRSASEVATSALGQEIERWMLAHLKVLEHQGLRVSSGSQGDVFGDMYEEFLEAVERPLLESMMRAFQNNRATIAAQLGLHRSTLRQKLRRYKID